MVQAVVEPPNSNHKETRPNLERIQRLTRGNALLEYRVIDPTWRREMWTQLGRI